VQGISHPAAVHAVVRTVAGLLERPLVVVDVGARWGVSRVWDELGDRCLTIGFEPDRAECERLADLHRGRGSIRFVPLALGPRPGSSTLYLTKGRGASSIYPPSEDAMCRHPALAEVLPVEETARIEMTTLDEWCAQEGVTHVDVIKLDTQGSELGVLEGAAEILRTVRAVEVEVEFNEIYAGAPLFGEVDRFLRERGFVLWKLRDLAHYPQAGAPTDWRAPDTCSFVDHLVSFASGAGQLFWANAFYLRAQTARPDKDAGWAALVRDACVTGAHAFGDLALLALDLARATGPDHVRELIDRALAGDAAGAGAEAASGAPGSGPATTLSFGDPGFQGVGWGPPQTLPFATVRWTGPGRDAWVDLPGTVRPGTRVELLVVAAMSPEISGGLAVEVDGAAVPLDQAPHEHGLRYSGVVPAAHRSSRGFTRVMVRTPSVVPWNAIHPESGDDSQLGVAVAWVRLWPEGPTPSG